MMSTETKKVSAITELDAAVGAYVAADHARGAVYGIVSSDGLVHSAGFGQANEAGARPAIDTPFPIASMSKSFTAAAVLIARDRGLLCLEDPITRYIPSFQASGAPEDPCDPPTIRMLLSMSGGLTEDNSWVDPQIDMTEEELLRLVGAGLKYSHTPGTVYEYSNLGFTLTGLVLQQVTGSQLEEFVGREILEPLGMRSTSFSPASYDPSTRATGYSLDSQGRWMPYPPQESGAFAAAGGIVSTISDLSVWVRWLGEAFRPGQSLGVDVLSRAARREMQRIEAVIPPSVALLPSGNWVTTTGGYGLGLHIDHDLRLGTFVSHSGGLPGFRLHMRWHPDSGYGVVILTNSHRGDPDRLVAGGLSNLLHEQRVPSETIVLWKETATARATAEALVRHWDDGAAARLFAENIDFDRPLVDRRLEIDRLTAEVGPLLESRPLTDVVSAATPADVTWSIPGERGHLLCMVHLNQLDPPKVQEFVVRAIASGTPESAVPSDISPRREGFGDTVLVASSNVRVVVPTLD